MGAGLAGAAGRVEHLDLTHGLAGLEGGGEQVVLDRRQDGRPLPLEDAGDGVRGLAAAARADDDHRGAVALAGAAAAAGTGCGAVFGGDEPAVDGAQDQPAGDGSAQHQRRELGEGGEPGARVHAQPDAPPDADARVQGVRGEKHGRQNRQRDGPGAHPVQPGRSKLGGEGAAPRNVGVGPGRGQPDAGSCGGGEVGGQGTAGGQQRRQLGARPHHPGGRAGGGDHDAGEQLERAGGGTAVHAATSNAPARCSSARRRRLAAAQ